MDANFFNYYGRGLEQQRLSQGAGRVELARTLVLLERFLPPPPAVICDVGGGSGAYAAWLARRGYTVHLVDSVPLHVEQARAASAAQPEHPLASVEVGDARRLHMADASAGAVLLLGPLYHLVERADRIQALREAARVLRPGGVLLAAIITRFTSTLYGVLLGQVDDPVFVEIARQDRQGGQHRNPTQHPDYFTTAYFHRPEGLKDEIEAAGLQHEATLAVEGPLALLPAEQLEQAWGDPARRQRLLDLALELEGEPGLMGVSPHLIGVGRRA